jgi:hypothetical protein
LSLIAGTVVALSLTLAACGGGFTGNAGANTAAPTDTVTSGITAVTQAPDTTATTGTPVDGGGSETTTDSASAEDGTCASIQEAVYGIKGIVTTGTAEEFPLDFLRPLLTDACILTYIGSQNDVDTTFYEAYIPASVTLADITDVLPEGWALSEIGTDISGNTTLAAEGPRFVDGTKVPFDLFLVKPTSTTYLVGGSGGGQITFSAANTAYLDTLPNAITLTIPR